MRRQPPVRAPVRAPTSRTAAAHQPTPAHDRGGQRAGLTAILPPSPRMPTRRAHRTSPLPLLALACTVACGGAPADDAGATDSDTDSTTGSTADSSTAPTTSGT